MNQFLRAALTAASLALASTSMQAANLSFTGSLGGDNDVRLFTFTLAADSDVTLRTWSYAGGTNASGSLIGSGGFDPIVTLFAGTGPSALLLTANDDGTGVDVDPGTGSAFDSLLEILALSAGTYTVALTEFDNFASGPTLGDGFGGNNIMGFDGRNANWALDILSVDSAHQIPEPAGLALAMLGLAAMRTVRRPVQPARPA